MYKKPTRVRRIVVGVGMDLLIAVSMPLLVTVDEPAAADPIAARKTGGQSSGSLLLQTIRCSGSMYSR